MKPINKIRAIRKDLEIICGADSPATKAVELREQYLKVAEEFSRVREFKSYTVALEFVSNKFHVSKSFVKHAISFSKKVGVGSQI